MNLNYDLIGVNIQRQREQKGITQEKLAEIIDSSERHIRRIEGGQCGVSLNLLVSIANALDVSIDAILYGNLNYSDSSIDREIRTLIIGCNKIEKSIILDILKHLKELLMKHGI